MSNPVTTNICNLDLIYNPDYKYSLPKSVLESFLSGSAFDNKENYTKKEFENLCHDINDLYQTIILENPVKENLVIITAGAPGAGKTVKLRQDLKINDLQGKHYAYICPDDVCLEKLTRTYKAELEGSDNSTAARQNAYNKWRPGANAATHLIVANLIREKYGFYFGSTSSHPETWRFFEFLDDQGYYIRLIHVSAHDVVRWSSIQERDKTDLHTTEQDVREKGLLVPQRINDTFLKYADCIDFYYREENHDTVLAATWWRNYGKKGLRTLEIVARDQYERIKAIHNEVAKALTRPDLFWESTVEESSKINEEKIKV